MASPDNFIAASKEIFKAVTQSSSGSQRIKARTLIKKFGFQRRTEENTSEITRALQEVGVIVHPSILKFGDEYSISLDDWIVLSVVRENPKSLGRESLEDQESADQWSKDDWFDLIKTKTFRTEREVETKFIIPLLIRLGYSDDDRYDNMPVITYDGSRKVIRRADFVLSCSNCESLKGQFLLVVEAKRASKGGELEAAFKQSKSYAFWIGCYHSLVTDGEHIEVFGLSANHVKSDTLLLRCHRNDLREKFPEIYNLVGKKALVKYFLDEYRLAEELRV